MVAWPKGGLSQSPRAWWARVLALSIGTALISLAVPAPPLVRDLADLAFTGPPGKLGSADASDALRIAFVVLGTAVRAVPGAWMDVVVGVTVALTLSAAFGDYRDRHALLACGNQPQQVQTPAAHPRKRACPQAALAPKKPAEHVARLTIPKTRAVAPALELPAGQGATLAAVVEERDAKGHTDTVARRYPVTPVAAIPANKLTGDIAVDVDTTDASTYDHLLADLTAAKALRLLPR